MLLIIFVCIALFLAVCYIQYMDAKEKTGSMTAVEDFVDAEVDKVESPIGISGISGISGITELVGISGVSSTIISDAPNTPASSGIPGIQ